MIHRKERTVSGCEHCRELEDRMKWNEMRHDAEMGRLIRRDTEIINGLLREIDALHLLLQKQGDHGGDSCNEGNVYIHNCQDMKL